MDEVSTWVDAPPEQVWPLICDVTRYGEWSPENQGARWDGTGRPGVGAKFTGANKHGFLRWKTHCTVTEYEEHRRFAFTVAESRARWGFGLTAQDGGTRIIQWRDKFGLPPRPIRWLENSGLLGKPRDAWIVDGMRQTLEAIKRTVERGKARLS
jgi:Polyketide cyclase / dehydrase and lipid transport